MFYKNCYIIQSLKQSLKINHYYFSLAMKNWGSKESKLLSQRSYPERAGHQAVLLCWLEAEVLPPPPELGVEVTCSKRLVSASPPFFISITACSLLLSAVTFLNVKLCVCRHIYTQKCKHLINLLLHPAPFSPALRRQNHVPLTKMTRS